jgi:DNA-binding transcriptional MocR family regulator
VLLSLLTDERTEAEVAAAREEYARRREVFVSVLAHHDVQVGGRDGLNVWVPVRDEAAALMRLAARGIGAAPGTPFNVLANGTGHIRVTVGLIDAGLEEVATQVAAAADIAGWGARAR